MRPTTGAVRFAAMDDGRVEVLAKHVTHWGTRAAVLVWLLVGALALGGALSWGWAAFVGSTANVVVQALLVVLRWRTEVARAAVD